MLRFGKSGIPASSLYLPKRRGRQKPFHLWRRIRVPRRKPRHPFRSARCAWRRRPWRSGRILRRQLSARNPFCPDPHHLSGRGRFLRRRKNRSEPCRREKPCRRILAAFPCPLRLRHLFYPAGRGFCRRRLETIKYGMIADRALFASLETDGFTARLTETVARCVRMKSEIVAKDEFDTGARQLLNFGPQVGHAIEKESAFSISHGHAVAMGMMAVTWAAERHGLCQTPCAAPLKALLQKAACPPPPRTESTRSCRSWRPIKTNGANDYLSGTGSARSDASCILSGWKRPCLPGLWL